MTGPPAQPPGAPPEQWQPRKDVVSRKVIDRLDRVSGELEEVQRKLATYVTLGWLIGVLGTASIVIIGASWGIARDTRAELGELRATMGADVRQVRAEMAGRATATEAQVNAVYKVLIEGRPRAQVRAEAEGAAK